MVRKKQLHHFFYELYLFDTEKENLEEQNKQNAGLYLLYRVNKNIIKIVFGERVNKIYIYFFVATEIASLEEDAT